MGAVTDGTDQVKRFLKDGVWEHTCTSEDEVERARGIQPGDRIAIKSTYVRRKGLPFNKKGADVSVMKIKATGLVTENLGNGRHFKVKWNPLVEPREWYFFTLRGPIWKVEPTDPLRRSLIAFAFEGESQPIEQFLKHPFWNGRYSDPIEPWVLFYEELASRLLEFRDRRADLLAILTAASNKTKVPIVVTDQFADGTTGLMRDICPFTFFAMFNRGITTENRTALAKELGSKLGIASKAPKAFPAIPIANNQKTWFFSYEKNRGKGDIDNLWEVFKLALTLDAFDGRATSEFIHAFDKAQQVKGTSWNLTMGLYWCRPHQFCPLDANSRNFIASKFGLEPMLDGQSYVELLHKLQDRFLDPDAPAQSFFDLSLKAWQTESDAPVVDQAPAPALSESRTYTLEDLCDEGCFIPRARLEDILSQLTIKKNIVLQGPPGTGKTWLAKRLGYALMQERDETRMVSIQFHPNLSYEDFVRGFRPGPGGLELVDGPLLVLAERARVDQLRSYVLIIEEINRGHPAQILGEGLTLLEADKRSPEDALRLCYARSDEERVYLPPNLFVIGTMNIADRSLALVDLALRRRFAFIDLEPEIGDLWAEWMQQHHPNTVQALPLIRQKLQALNLALSGSAELGHQYRIGHSYVTPHCGQNIESGAAWFSQVVRHQIRPLLAEYWFDRPDRVEEEVQRLLQGL